MSNPRIREEHAAWLLHPRTQAVLESLKSARDNALQELVSVASASVDPRVRGAHDSLHEISAAIQEIEQVEDDQDDE